MSSSICRRVALHAQCQVQKPAFTHRASTILFPLHSATTRLLHSSLANLQQAGFATSTSTSSLRYSAFDRSKACYSSLRIFKSRAALDIAMFRPRVKLASNERYYRLERTGGFRLDFAAAKAENQYDWYSKQFIALDTNELGQLLAFHHSNENEKKFFHDPGLGSEEAGQSRKELSIRRNGPGKGFFFNLTSTIDRIKHTPISVPVSDSEWLMLITLIEQNLTGLLGMNPQVIEPLVEETTETNNNQQQTMNWEVKV